MVICRFCGEIQDDADALQLHHALDCSGIKLEQSNTQGNHIVEFVWIPDDDNIKEEAVFLLGSYLLNNIELNLEEGVYKSIPTEVQYGDFNGQLVVGDDIVPVNDFRIDVDSDVIYLTRNASTADEESTAKETSKFDIHGDSENLLGDDDINNHSKTSHIPLGHTHMQDDHTLKQIDDIFDDEIGFSINSYQNSNSSSPKIQEIDSGDDYDSNQYSPRFGEVENTKNEKSFDDSPRIDNDSPHGDEIATTQEEETNSVGNDILEEQQLDDVSVDQIMSELQMSEQEDHYADDFEHDEYGDHFKARNSGDNFLPSNAQYLPSEPSYKSHTGDIMRQSSNKDSHRQNSGDNFLPSNAQYLPSEPSYKSHTGDIMRQSSNKDSPRQNSGDNFLPSDAQYLPSEPSYKSHTGDITRQSSNKSSPRRSISGSVKSHGSSNVHSPRHSVRSDTVINSPTSKSFQHEKNFSSDLNSVLHERDQLTRDYQLKCQSHKEEIEKANNEINRLQELTENYKEVKLELETKCLSYSVEVERLKNEVQKYQQLVKKKETEHEELVQDLILDKQTLSKKCQQLELDIQGKQLDLENMAHKVREMEAKYSDDNKGLNDELVAELEAKCQSFDLQVSRLTKERDDFKEKFMDALSRVTSLSTKNHELEREKQILSDENQSLETASKLHAEEVKNERDNMDIVIKKLQKDIGDLQTRYQHITPQEKNMDIEAKKRIEKLNQENKFLKEKLKLIRSESDVTNNNAPITSSPILNSHSTTSKSHNYQPHIVSSSRHDNNALNRTPEHLRSRTFSNGIDLPSRRSDEYSNNLHASHMLPSRYNPSDYTTRHSPSDYTSRHSPLDYTSRRAHSPPVSVALSSKNVMNGSFDERLDTIMRRYSGGESKKNAHLQDSYLPSRRSHFEDYDQNFNKKKSISSSNRYSLKSRSLDLGMDSIGLSDEDATSATLSKRYDSLNRVPFCPTTIDDLRIGMKVSVSRTNGRLSRGVVKWIGNLPNRLGDFVGVELETESGKHDGYFEGVRFFKCNPGRGVFVKFNKVIMAWR